jgi:putative membrane protein
MNILARWAILALSVWAATALVPGITVHGGAWDYFWVALIFSLLNTFLGSFLKLMTLPAVILSAGLFLIVINAAMLELTAHWTHSLTIKSFWSAIFASIIISLVSGVGKGMSKQITPKQNWS